MSFLFFIQAYYGIISQSASYDETPYLGIGKYLLKTHRWDVPGSILHPPLAFYLPSLPLLFVDTNESVWRYPDAHRDLTFLGSQDLGRGQALLSSIENSDDRLLIMSRLMVALTGVLLGYVVYRFASELYGEKAGALAMGLYTFCPNMIAFSGFIVPDVVLTLFYFLSVFWLWKAIRTGGPRHHVIAGFSLGLALLSKFTALILLPVEAILIALSFRRDRVSGLKLVPIVFLVASAVFLSGYFFDISPYLKGIEFQRTHAEQGHGAFLMGQYSTHGWWYYYLVTFLIKTPLPTLLLLSAAIYVYARDVKRGDRNMAVLFLALPAAAVFGFFSLGDMDIGLRYILPVYPFIYASIGRLTRAASCTMRYFIYAMVLWQAGAAAFVAPHYISYFNEAIGGPANGYKYLVDCNLDWGQDLKSLKRYMDRNKIDSINLSYFGTDLPERYGIRYVNLHDFPLDNPKAEIPPGLIAISVTDLQGIYFNDKTAFSWLKAYTPVGRVGYSMLIYDISQ